MVKLTLSLASKSTKKSKRASPSAFRVLGRDSILVMFKSYFQKYLRTSCKAPGLSLSSNTQLIFGVASGVVLVAEMKLRGIKGKKGQMVGIGQWASGHPMSILYHLFDTEEEIDKNHQHIVSKEDQYNHPKALEDTKYLIFLKPS